MRVAIFDFDGTLYAKETFQVLMKQLKHHPTYQTNYNQFMRGMVPRYIGYKMKLYPEARMKERSMQLYLEAIADMSEEELATFFEETAASMKSDFNPEVIAKLHEHINDEVRVMIVSGAYTPLLDAALAELPFDDIIGSDVTFDQGFIDKHAPLYHISGKRKNKHIFQVLDGQTVDWPNSFAYADSYSDLSVLELVGHPIAVQPEERLKTIALKRGWEIL